MVQTSKSTQRHLHRQKKDTQSTVEQSFKMMRIMVMTGVSQDCPRSLRFQKTGKKARYKKMFEEEMKR